MGGRTYELFTTATASRWSRGARRAAVYWVSNTLLAALTNQQMLAIARSLTRVGER